MRDLHTTETPTTELYLDAVLERQSCQKHDAEKGSPCWGITESSGVGRGAVCNKRAKRAGFNNKVSEKSLRLNRHKK
jgi:hypothetical protein